MSLTSSRITTKRRQRGSKSRRMGSIATRLQSTVTKVQPFNLYFCLHRRLWLPRSVNTSYVAYLSPLQSCHLFDHPLYRYLLQTTLTLSKMALNRRHSRPYKVSSNEWVSVSETSVSSGRASKVLSMEDLSDLQVSAHTKGVLRVFSKIYALAKILHVAFLAYGVEVCITSASDWDLEFWRPPQRC